MATAAQATDAKQIRAEFLQRLTTPVELVCPKRGPPRKLSIPYVIDRILHVCFTGCSWRDLEVQGGSPKTVYHQFNRWSRKKIFDAEFYELAKQYSNSRGDARGNLVADTSFVKNVHGRTVVGKCPVARGRKATKVSVLSDTHGAPLAACYHAANKNDCTTLAHLLAPRKHDAGAARRLSDASGRLGYDTEACRNACVRRGLLPIIDRKQRRTLQGEAAQQAPAPPPDPRGARRIMVEHVFGRIDLKRRLRARYEATIWNFRSFHSIGFSWDLVRRLMRMEANP
jgi:transposase